MDQEIAENFRLDLNANKNAHKQREIVTVSMTRVKLFLKQSFYLQFPKTLFFAHITNDMHSDSSCFAFAD